MWVMRRVGKSLQIAILVASAATIGVTIPGCSTHKSAPEQDEFSSAKNGLGLTTEQCEANGHIQEASAQDNNYRIQSGDQLTISFYLNPEFNQEVTVAPDGKAMLMMVGPVQAAGLTPDRLSDLVDKSYQSELKNPGAVVHVKNMPGRMVYVQGQVSKPGAFPLQPGMTALQAISEAGGLTPEANAGNTVLIRHDACGQPQGSKVDLMAAVNSPGKGDDAVLASRDVVVVPRSAIANVDLFVKQYIRDAMPVEPYIGLPF
jgi:polysaccharide biosynthesis/export protein